METKHKYAKRTFQINMKGQSEQGLRKTRNQKRGRTG